MANNSSQSSPETSLFLSYSHTDRKACIDLRLALEQVGLDVFQDEGKIRTGDQWLTELEKALKGCSAFVLLIGRDGVQRWVGAEVQVALIRYFSPHDDARRLPIFPILLDEAKPESLPPFLALFQAEKWSPEKPLPEKLIEAIKARAIRVDDRQPFEGCPFLGLSAFGKKDAKLFFGRRQETLEALTFLGDQKQTNPEKLHKSSGMTYHRWLQIEGNSGSGKSSLVQAGLLPMIERGALWARTGFDQWRILGPMMPGKNPVKNLLDALIHGLTDTPSERIDLTNKIQLEKPDALASVIKAYKTSSTQTAYLLIVDQFEELFTFSDESLRKHFDILLTDALQDTNCPLFLISTVRADFLDRFEYLPNLQKIYNRHCKRYFLPTISIKGLQEIIEQPARLAGLDVSEVTAVILKDAENEIGALPLVENALSILYKKQQPLNKLSGDYYRQQGGIAGMLSKAADELLDRIEKAFPKKGKQAALEMLLALTRVNDEGRNTRKRISREDAIYAAGKGDDSLGEQVLRMLSGERTVDNLNTGYNDTLRLVTISKENNPQGEIQQFVDLIHETLVRARPRNDKTQKTEGYWPTLYQYLEKHPDREILHQQLSHKAKLWQEAKFLGKIWRLTYSYFDLKSYRKLSVRAKTLEGKFLSWSNWALMTLILVVSIIVIYTAESIYWVQKHDLSLDMIGTLQRFRIGDPVLPDLTDKPIPIGTFKMGEQDAAFIAELVEENKKHFGVLGPDKLIQITQPFYLGVTEVTYEQFDYYVWQQRRSGNTAVTFPNSTKGGRGNQPVVNVSWFEAVAYAHWLGEQTNNQCRLPKEAEWEYAARAGTDTAYYWGDDVGKNNANCDGCVSQWEGEQAAPVGQFKANDFKLHDMAGNVWEWTCSNWSDQFGGSEQQCNDDDTDTEGRVLRGASWYNGPDYVRSSARSSTRPDFHDVSIGFRVWCSSPIE